MIPENIKQLANKVRDEIYGRDVRESIAQSMEVSGETSNEANERSKDTATRQTDVENRFDDQIAGNTDIDEVIDARRPEGGESYPTLRKRLDDEHKEVTAQLAQIALNIKNFGAVGDGLTDDTVAIQSALDMAGTLKGEVIVPPSDQPYIFTHLHVPSNVTFRSTGGVLKYKDNTAVDENVDYYLIENLDEENTTFKELIVDGNGANNTAFAVADIITCVGKKSKVIGCKLYDAPDSAIMFSTTETGECADNYIDGATDIGIYVNGSTDKPVIGATVTGNKTVNCRHGGIALKRESDGVIVANNSILKCGNGITVEDFTDQAMGYPKNAVITGNFLNGIGYMFPESAIRGISISKTEGTIVTNNTILDCSGASIIIVKPSENVTIKDNIVRGSDGDLGRTQNGLWIDGGTNLTISGNNVQNIRGNGLYLANVSKSLISENHLTSLNHGALYANAQVTDCIITKNMLDGGSTDAELYPFKSIYKDNIHANATNDFNKVGIRSVSAGQPLPNNDYSVRFVGEKIVHLLNDTWWVSNSLTNGDWTQISNT